MSITLRFSVILIALFLFSGNADSQTNRVGATEDSVAQIITVFRDNKTVLAAGTAFFVSPTLIATASHVYWDAGKAAAENRCLGIFLRKVSTSGKGFVVPIELIADDNLHDLALLKFDPEKIKAQWPDFAVKPLSISEQEPSIADPIFCIGYFGQDRFPIASRGIVANVFPIQYPQVEVRELLMNMTVNLGQSGAPVLSESGQVVGVVLSFVPFTNPQGGQSQSGIAKAALSPILRLLVIGAGR
jgi:S1-C subfamily serine protease